MEKGNYSINDIKNLFNIFKVGDILYFRNDDLVVRFGATYDIEIKLRVVSLREDKLFVECISYVYNLAVGSHIIMSNNVPHTVDKSDFKSLFRFPKYH